MKRPKRAYIGNLRPRPDLERKLYRELFLPFCLSVRNFTDGHEHGHGSGSGSGGGGGGGSGGGGGIVVVRPKLRSGPRDNDDDTNAPSANTNTNNNHCYALVEFTDVEYAIQMLNGVQFDGRTLKVDREKKTMDAAGGWNGGGFGSGRWIGGGGGRGGARSAGRGRGNRNDDNSVNRSKGGATFQKSETSEPNPPTTGKYNRDEDQEEAIARRVGEVIASQIDESSDPVGTAIAGTAAVTFLASVDALGLVGGDVTDAGTDPDTGTGTASINDNNNENSVDVALEKKARDQSNDKLQGTTILTDDDFQKRRQLPMTELLAEYGEEDPNWKKQSYPTAPKHGGKEKDVREDDDDDATSGTNDDVDYGQRRNMPLADLLAEYGERDADWKKRQQPPRPLSSSIVTTASNTVNGDETSTRMTNSSKNQSHNRNKNNHNQNNIHNNNNHKHTQNHKQGMLAPSTKSSIHVEILSFGYKYGAPPKRDKSFDYAHPLPPWDVRDLEKAPADIAKFHGLSHWVKRALLNPGGRGGGHVHDDDDDNGDGDGDDDNNNGDGNGDDNTETKNNHRKQKKEPSPMRKRANEMADEIIRTIVESIDEGGHGPISPLNMTISIGSEYGRHRSVVLAEHLAVVLRARLRRNDGRRFGESDGGNGNGNGIVTQLVSVGTRHRDLDARHVDEEAFGNKREARAMEKARKRQMDLEWGDDHW